MIELCNLLVYETPWKWRTQTTDRLSLTCKSNEKHTLVIRNKTTFRYQLEEKLVCTLITTHSLLQRSKQPTRCYNFFVY